MSRSKNSSPRHIAPRSHGSHREAKKAMGGKLAAIFAAVALTFAGTVPLMAYAQVLDETSNSDTSATSTKVEDGNNADESQADKDELASPEESEPTEKPEPTEEPTPTEEPKTGDSEKTADPTDNDENGESQLDEELVAEISPFLVIDTECGNGAECAGLTLRTVVNGGSATAGDFTLKAVQNNATADEFFFQSGVKRTVPRYSGSSNNSRTVYALSATPNTAAAADYTQSLSCSALAPTSGSSNNQTTFNSSNNTVRFGLSNDLNPTTRYADCTFTMNYNVATVQVQVGGDRSGSTTINGLANVQLGLFTSLTAANPVNNTWAVCTSDSTGLCEFKIPDAASGGTNYDRELYVRAIGPTSGTFVVHKSLGIGSSGENSTEYGFRVGQVVSNSWRLRAGNTYTSGTQFMLDTGNFSNIASGGVFQTVRANPVFPPKCGIDVALILDVSGSVNGYQDNLVSAATALVNALTGTPSRMALFSFNNSAPASILANRPNLQAVSTPDGASIVDLHAVSYI